MDRSLEIRPAADDDVAGAAEVMIRSRRCSVPAIPPMVHPDDEVRAWFAGRVVPPAQLWVATEQTEVIAMMLVEDDWIDQLYVDPDRTGHGIGSTLVDIAKTGRDFLQLWTFQSNVGARRFYAQHGFAEVQFSDGDNEESSPDVRCEWHRGQSS